jgi:hypothetical protein
MTITTPPQELFRELSDIGGLVFNLLTGPKLKVKRWPPYYQIYVELDRLCWSVSRATAYLLEPFDEADGHPDLDRIEGANLCFGRIDASFKAIVNILAHMDRRQLIMYENPPLKDLVYNHFSPKSAWYMALNEQYFSGRISANGRMLERNALLLDPVPTYRVLDIEEKHLAPWQNFDLTSEESRTVLVRTVNQVQKRLGEVYAAVGSHFVSNCLSVKELLHPSMI